MKRRIFFGLAPLFILLLAMGVYAVTLFAKLGGRIDVILRENFRSVLAGQEMKETAERMDSALFFSLAGEEDRGRKLYAQNLPVFRESLRTELGNITLPGEAELATKLKQAHEEYARARRTFWATPDWRPAAKCISVRCSQPLRASKTARRKSFASIRRIWCSPIARPAISAAESTRYMILAIVAGIAGAVFFAARLQRSILAADPSPNDVSKELGEGKLDQVVPVSSHDEFGQLADTFNKMATKLRAYRQAMGDQVLQARQMTEITFSAFPDPIIALNADGRIDFTNPAATRFLYHTGQTDSIPASVQAEVDRVFRGAPDFLPTSFERVLVFRVEGHEVFMLPRVIGMRDESGHIFGVAVILQDVTRLRLLDEVKTNLVSTVSHELKTPLTSVRMGLHLLLEERIGALNNKQTELLLAAREDSERLLRMINDLLDLAKLESGKAVLPSEVIEPRELVESAGEDLRGLVESRGSRLVTKDRVGIAESLRRCATDFARLFEFRLKCRQAHESRRGDRAPREEA